MNWINPKVTPPELNTMYLVLFKIESCQCGHSTKNYGISIAVAVAESASREEDYKVYKTGRIRFENIHGGASNLKGVKLEESKDMRAELSYRATPDGVVAYAITTDIELPDFLKESHAMD